MTTPTPNSDKNSNEAPRKNSVKDRIAALQNKGRHAPPLPSSSMTHNNSPFERTMTSTTTSNDDPHSNAVSSDDDDVINSRTTPPARREKVGTTNESNANGRVTALAANMKGMDMAAMLKGGLPPGMRGKRNAAKEGNGSEDREPIRREESLSLAKFRHFDRVIIAPGRQRRRKVVPSLKGFKFSTE